jgi:hypothetical protein
MISKPNAVVSKGMIFAGCSFTWGQGLYYYSNMPSLKEPPPDHYRSQLVRWSHHKFQETIRYPRLVANHFNTFELTQDFNGGATHSIIKYWEEKFFQTGDFQKSIEDRAQNYDYDDISHVFFQFTQWSRTELTIEHGGKTIGPKQRYEIWQSPEHLSTFIQWLNAQNITFDEFIHRSKKEEVARVRAFLEKFEQHGAKTAVLSWPEDMVEYITADPWLSERFIQLEHNGSTWSSIEKLMKVHQELTINSDFEYFEDTPKDHHPSKTCHRIMANAIIKYLEKSKLQ